MDKLISNKVAVSIQIPKGSLKLLGQNLQIVILQGEGGISWGSGLIILLMKKPDNCYSHENTSVLCGSLQFPNVLMGL